MITNRKVSRQTGSALLASLILVVIFTLVGMTAAKKGILGEKAARGAVDRMTAEEAAEISLAAIIDLIEQSNGPLNSSTSPDVQSLSTASATDIGHRLAWNVRELANLFNTPNISGLIRPNSSEPDSPVWTNRGIVNAGLQGTIYDVLVDRRVQTYSFIESYYYPLSLTGSRPYEKGVYIITVKAAVYTPFTPTGTIPFLPGSEIEQANTILQVAYQKIY